MASKNNINSVFTDIANSIRAKKGTTNPIQPINMSEEIDGIITGIDGVEAYNGDASHILITKPKSYISINENVEQLEINKNASILVDSQDGTGLVNIELNSGTINIDGMSYVLGAMTFTESALVNTVNIDKVALTIDFSRDSYDHVINVNSADTSINVNNGQTDITNNESGVINLDNKGSLTIASNSGNVTAENLTAENIKEGVSILGKVGTFKGGSSGSTLKKLLDATKSAYYLFYQYQGTSVSDLITYSDTENVTNMMDMFENSKIETAPLINTSNVTDMDYMFYQCSNLTTIPQLDTSKNTSMYYTFGQCSNLQIIDITHMKITSTSSSSNMCNNCYSLTKFIIRNMDTIPALNSNAFYNCYHFTGTVNATYNPEGLKNGRIYVPDGMVDSLKSATNWSVYADIIVPLSTLVE